MWWHTTDIRMAGSLKKKFGEAGTEPRTWCSERTMMTTGPYHGQLQHELKTDPKRFLDLEVCFWIVLVRTFVFSANNKFVLNGLRQTNTGNDTFPLSLSLSLSLSSKYALVVKHLHNITNTLSGKYTTLARTHTPSIKRINTQIHTRTNAQPHFTHTLSHFSKHNLASSLFLSLWMFLFIATSFFNNKTKGHHLPATKMSKFYRWRKNDNLKNNFFFCKRSSWKQELWNLPNK